MSQGFVFWRGRSPVDGAPLVAIATMDSDNRKTGKMVQTWILRADMDPINAVRMGADRAICGDCAHRGIPGVTPRTCYVVVFQGPRSVFATYQRGGYVDLSDDIETQQWLLQGRHVRLGAYGDPGMVPSYVWHGLLFTAAGNTGYTHQWREKWAEAHKNLVMASVDSSQELAEARAAGWRTFRVRSEHEPLEELEFTCPASDEGGKRLQCISCGACDGADRPGKASVVILAHGQMAKHFKNMQSIQTEAA